MDYVVLDVTFGGTTVTTTPGHAFYSASRRAWVPAGSLRPGELLRDQKGATSPVLAISPPRHGFVEVYGIEVEEAHTYFVGGEAGAALVHNGVEDPNCPVPPASPATTSNPGSSPLLPQAQQRAAELASLPKNSRPSTATVFQPADGGPPVSGRGSTSDYVVRPGDRIKPILDGRTPQPNDPAYVPGSCSEIDALNNAAAAGRPLQGGQILTVNVRPLGNPNAGTIKDPCPFCQTVLNALGITW